MNEYTKIKSTNSYLECECPICGKSEFSFDVNFHFSKTEVKDYIWSCDRCLHRIEFVCNPNKDILWKDLGKQNELKLVVLKIDLEKPLYVLVEDRYCSGEVKDTKYYYEEHTCPTNVTHDIIKYVYDNDDDPHGIFEFVACIPTTHDEMGNIKDDWNSKEISQFFTSKFNNQKYLFG
jgi:hypothetical protein